MRIFRNLFKIHEARNLIEDKEFIVSSEAASLTTRGDGAFIQEYNRPHGALDD